MKSSQFVVLVGLMALAIAAWFVDPTVGYMLAAVVAVKSTVIANADATPSVINDAGLARARQLISLGVVTATNGDSIASTYRVARIKSSDRVHRVLLDNATWGAACTADVGLYQTAQNGGAVVDADLFASAVDMNAANRALDVTRESGVITVANMEKRVWELIGLTADPQREYDVALTLVAAAAATGAGAIRVEVNGGT